jgi:cytoskeletal protein CcmA (bactofilin family)
MFGNGKRSQQPALTSSPTKVNSVAPPTPPLLTVVGENARMEGKFDITDSIQIECDVGGEVNVGGKLVIGEKGVVHANVQTADAIIMGQYEGNMVATGEVEIAETGRVSGNIQTDSLVIMKGGFFNGNVVKLNEGASHRVLPIEEKLATQRHAGDMRAERDEKILRS